MSDFIVGYWVDSREPLWYEDLHNQYEEMLDDVYGEVQAAELKFLVGRIIRELDPIAFRCGALDWLDELMLDGELVEELDELDDEEDE